MDMAHQVDFLTGFNLEGYANRDSTVYKELYGITTADTVLRGTLRYSGYCDAVKGLHAMGLLDPEQHPSLHPRGPDISWRQFMCTLVNYPEGNILLSNLRNLVSCTHESALLMS